MDLSFKHIASNALAIELDKPVVYLVDNSWDDFSFQTTFSLILFDEQKNKHYLGKTKIGVIGQEESRTSIPETFNALDESFFSLGQSTDYYQGIQKLNPELKNALLTCLNDLASNNSLLEKALQENVMKKSLLRDVSISSIKGQFKRLLEGGALLTEYNFQYAIPQEGGESDVKITFHVDPESNPPSNTHVLIGRNGVGKTYLLNDMITALINSNESHKKSQGSFSAFKKNGWGHSSSIDNLQELFAGVVSVTFSAFDPFEPYPEEEDKTKGIRYSYVGLKKLADEKEAHSTTMNPEMLANEFTDSLKNCIDREKRGLWIKAIQNLESDTQFSEFLLSELIHDAQDEDVEDVARNVFNNLSSGHKIVLLTITKLVEKVEEKTLILLDEPESHLHPPLLSAFIRTLSELLSHRNGVAIIATHSPVIVQEVPQDCVWKLRKSGSILNAERPEIQTFGENVGLLTREIFGLEVTQAGYHQLLENALEKSSSYEDILHDFNGQLGAEARAILKGLLYHKSKNEG